YCIFLSNCDTIFHHGSFFFLNIQFSCKLNLINHLIMKVIEQRLPREFDKSFTVFCEKGNFFPCPWHHHPEFEFVLVTKSTGRRMVGDHIDFFEEGDLVFLGPWLPHVWVNDPEYLYGKSNRKAE